MAVTNGFLPRSAVQDPRNRANLRFTRIREDFDVCESIIARDHRFERTLRVIGNLNRDWFRFDYQVNQRKLPQI